jgi:hypothetical protein
MDLGSAIGSVFAAVGLSGAAGLNAYLPLLVSAVLDRVGWVELGAPFGELSSTPGLAVLGALCLADLVGDKVPGLDHVLHLVGLAVAPASGAILFAGQTGIETDIPTAVAAVLGALTAGSLHAGRAAVRPGSTVATAGIGNPFLSLGEDLASLVLTIVAFALPLLALLLVIALAPLAVAALRRWRRRPEPG